MDEYHLQIRRGADLMGRWYLADVEVVREIAERFTLYLGDDELEFLADDALVFAYDGVTRMQQAWLKAQKKKRRHRRAAAEAARRKDSEADERASAPPPPPPPMPETEAKGRRKPAPAPSSELAKKLAAIAAAEAMDEVASSPPRKFSWAEEERAELAGDRRDPDAAFDWAKVRDQMAIGPMTVGHATEREAGPVESQNAVPSAEAAPSLPEEEVVAARPRSSSRLRRRQPADTRAESPAGPEAVPPPPPPIEVPVWTIPAEREPEWIEPVVAPAAHDVGELEVTLPTEPDVPEDTEPPPTWITPPESTNTDLRRRYAAIEEAVRSNGSHTAPPMEVPLEEPDPTPARTRRGLRARSRDREIQLTVTSDTEAPTAPAPEPVTEPTKSDPRLEGHHPIESSTGFLGRFRRAPKVPEDHVHVYQDARPSVGLTRRVCIECSHVSIGSED